MQIERIPSGIPGLDKLMEGGFVKSSVNLISGPAGTGKTIFCCQFLWHGIQSGEKGLYITLEESSQDIINDVKRFGWNFEEFKDKCKIVDMPPSDIKDLSSLVYTEIKRFKPSRFVLDSLSVATMGWKERPEEVFKSRIKVFDLIKVLKRTGVTSLLVCEIPWKSESLSRFGFEEFVVDGIIILRILPVDVPMRTLQILKMRRTNHSIEIHRLKVTKNGLIVEPST